MKDLDIAEAAGEAIVADVIANEPGLDLNPRLADEGSLAALIPSVQDGILGLVRA